MCIPSSLICSLTMAQIEALEVSPAAPTPSELVVTPPHEIGFETVKPDLNVLKLCMPAAHDVPPALMKQSSYERANPNQPWYAKYQKRRKRR